MWKKTRSIDGNNIYKDTDNIILIVYESYPWHTSLSPLHYTLHPIFSPTFLSICAQHKTIRLISFKLENTRPFGEKNFKLECI